MFGWSKVIRADLGHLLGLMPSSSNSGGDTKIGACEAGDWCVSGLT